MSDKKEIATLSIKISVDSTDLDKLEAQLKRIEGLMVSTGLKQSTSVGFSADMFLVKNGQVFIDAPLVTKATVKPTVEYTISGLHSDEYKEDLKQAVKQAIRPVIRQHIKVERVKEKQPENVFRGGVRVDKEEPATAKLDKAEIKAIDAAKYIEELSTAFAKSNESFAEVLTETISFDTPVTNKDFEQFKQQVEANFNQLQSSITAMQCTQAASEQAIAQNLTRLQREVTGIKSAIAVTNDSITNAVETTKAQEEALIEAMKKAIAEDIARGGRMFRGLR